jgi:membrane protease YdiL (CAAX protease family)
MVRSDGRAASFHLVLSRRTAAVQVVAVVLWAGAVAVSFLVILYPAAPTGWARTLLQLLAFVLLASPAFVLRPLPRLPLRATAGNVIASALLLAAALVVLTAEGPGVEQGAQHVVRAMSAGLGEDLLFRGLLLDRLRVLMRSAPTVAVVNGLLFGLYHVPVVLLQHGNPTALLLNTGFGILFAAVRLLSRGLLLPVALHVAVDLV